MLQALPFFYFALLQGCDGTPMHRVEQPLHGVAKASKLAAPEAIQIATALATNRGIDLKEYEPPTAAFDSTRREWNIRFEHKPILENGKLLHMLGGYFNVIVDDRTKGAELFGGA